MTRDGNITLKPGVTLFEYRIDSVLGQGGFGITYKATDLQLNRTVAIKEYFPREFSHRDIHSARVVSHGSTEDRETFEWGLKRFLAEARTLARFHHPSIVAIRRFFEFNDTAYIVMDFAEGRSLSEILKEKGSLSWGEVKSFLPSLLDGLAIVHKSGVLHRDIKPANIYLRIDGTPILLDFGSASQEIVQHSRSVTSIASAGYGAVEQYSTHGKQAEYTDIYGLAATLYHVVTGMKPQDAPDRILEDRLESAARVCKGRFPASFLSAIDNGLNVRPEARPKDIQSWSNQLLSDSAGNQTSALGSAYRSTQSDHFSVKSASSNAGESNSKKYISLAIIIFVIGLWWVFYNNIGENQSVDNIIPSTTNVEEDGDISALAKNANAVQEEAELDDISKINKNTDFTSVYSKKCPEDVRLVWNMCYGKFTYDSGATYEGDFVDNKFNGIGRVRFKNGEVFVGRFIDNMREGHGKFFYDNGDIYIGEFKKDFINGLGTYFVAADKTHFAGRWMDNGSELKRIDGDETSKPAINPNAILIIKNALLQEAGLDNINKISKNLKFIPVYSKQCPKEDQKWDECYGKFYYENGDSYEGDWVDNEMTGVGIYRSKNSGIYIGQFSENNYEGYGKYFWPDGNIYIGEFKMDKINGIGTLFYATGQRSPGRWLDNEKGLNRISDY